MAGVIVHHEILREELQHHAVFHQLHARGAVDHAVHVALLDLPHVAEFEDAAAVGAAHRGAAHADHRRFHRRRRRCFGLAQRRATCDSADGLLVGDPALHPALRLDGARAQKADAAVLQRRRSPAASGGCRRRVPLRKLVSLPWALLFLLP